MVDLNGDKEERKERPIYTGPQTDGPVSGNATIACVLLSFLVVISCIVLIIVVSITR